MRMSVHLGPSLRPEYAMSQDSDKDTAAKFTSVNTTSMSPPRAFGFRPDDSSPPLNHSIPVTDRLESQFSGLDPGQERHNAGVSENIPSRASPYEPPQDYEPHKASKRKRSDDSSNPVSLERTRPSSPTHHRADIAESSFVDRRPARQSWPVADRPRDLWLPLSQRLPTQVSPEQRLAESLQREIEAAEAQHSYQSNSPEDEDSSHYAAHKETNDSDPAVNGDESNRPPRKRQFANRTKTGCHTCRSRKKKCDETKPACNNCIRGEFFCQGYGDKRLVRPAGAVGKVPLRPSQKASNSPSPYSKSVDSATASNPLTVPRSSQPTGPQWRNYHSQDGNSGSSRLQPREDDFYADQHENWPKPAWSETSQPPYQSNAQTYRESNRYPPAQELTREHNDRLASAARYGQAIAPALVNTASRSSIDSSRSVLTAQMALQQSTTLTKSQLQRMTEKDKMLIGQLYRHFVDRELCEERQFCKVALERFNNAARPSAGASVEEMSRLLRAIVCPDRPSRVAAGNKDYPVGTVGQDVLVEAPFTCDYGYNINLDDNVVIQAGCVMIDPCKISIGARTIIGLNVKFYGKTLPFDSKLRGGRETFARGGTITIEEDCYIGDDVIIMPYRTIRKGSVVEPGTVVRQDVQPNTVVAGNPMRVVRGIGPSDSEQYEQPIQAENEIALAAMISERYRDERIPHGR